MSMTPLKIRYAMDRVKELEKAQLDKIKEKHTTPGKEASSKELFAAMRAGKLPLRSDVCPSNFNEYTELRYIYDMHALNTPDKFDQKAYDKEAKPIIKAANTAKDFIMLGDEVEALRCIREFEDNV